MLCQTESAPHHFLEGCFFRFMFFLLLIFLSFPTKYLLLLVFPFFCLLSCFFCWCRCNRSLSLQMSILIKNRLAIYIFYNFRVKNCLSWFSFAKLRDMKRKDLNGVRRKGVKEVEWKGVSMRSEPKKNNSIAEKKWRVNKTNK